MDDKENTVAEMNLRAWVRTRILAEYRKWVREKEEDGGNAKK